MNNIVRWRIPSMLTDNWIMGAVDILLAMFTAYIFFLYFDIFFKKKERSIGVLIGIVVFIRNRQIIPR